MCTVELLRFDTGAFLIGAEPGADHYSSDGKLRVNAPDNGRFVFNGEFDLMQFTGLLDKNEKEIYESDRVCDPYANPGEGELFTVKYDNEMARFILDGEGDADWDETDWQIYDNIYESKPTKQIIQ